MISINEDNFDKEVIECLKPVVVDFWAYECYACKIATSYLFELEKAYGEKVKFTKVDLDEERGLIKRFTIKTLPTIIGYQNEQQKFRIEGFRKNEIEKSLRNLL